MLIRLVGRKYTQVDDLLLLYMETLVKRNRRLLTLSEHITW